MKILLDTNFLITCMKQKIDFVELLNEELCEKIIFIIPEEVIKELEDISVRKKTKGSDKDSAKLAIQIIEKIPYKVVKLNNKNTDEGIVKFIKNKNIALATLDKKLKNRIENKIITILGKKRIQII